MRYFPLLLGLAATFSPAGAGGWIALTSPNFDLLTDATGDAARERLIELEQFRAQFLDYTGLKPDIPQRTRVILFATDDEFKKHRPKSDGQTINAAAFFRRSELDTQMVLSLGANGPQGRALIFHEYVHALYDELGWSPPLWFDEGSAEMFSTFETKRDIAYFGRAPEAHVQFLREHDLLPLPVVFSLTTASPDYHEGVRQGLFYAESWAFVHYLACNRDPTFRARLNRFLALLAGGRPDSEDTFREAFGCGYAAMESRLDSYIHGGAYVIAKVRFDRGRFADAVRTRPVNPNEVEIELAIVDAEAGESARAAYQLIVLREKNPASARLHEAAAIKALRDEDVAGVREELWRAVDLETTNIRARLYLARLLIRTWLTNDISPAKRIGEATHGQLRRLLDSLAVVAPNSLEVWDAFARTETFAPAPDPGTVDRIEKTVRSLPPEPQTMQIYVLLGLARRRLGDAAAARALAATVEASPITAGSTRRLCGSLLPATATPGSGTVSDVK